MILSTSAVLFGLLLLVWSADRFIEGAAVSAARLGVPTLVVGMLVVGFGTSAPEMLVSAMASLAGSPALALGNAYGSNIVNTSLIVGLTAVLSPIAVHSRLVRRELPLLLGVTILSGVLVWDRTLARWECLLLLAGFVGMLAWTLYYARRSEDDALREEIESEVSAHQMPLPRALFRLVSGLVLLVVASRLLVWGAVEIAGALGVSDLIVGLTIVAIGTSLPELAASIVAVRRNEHDLALGNVVGSNLFNLLAVVGIAGAIAPLRGIEAEVVGRDFATVLGLTVLLAVLCLPFRGERRVSRLSGVFLVGLYVAYTTVVVRDALV
jgi:cation:H+ antiporter